MTNKYCNICGKEFDTLDSQGNLGLHNKVGYGSKYDLCNININMCCACFDKLMDYLLPQCKIDPVTEYLS